MGSVTLPPLPTDYLTPVWRLRPDRPGPAALALDPREACYVVANGCTLDGIAYTATFTGWDGITQPDGRVTVRLEPMLLESRDYVSVTGRPDLKVAEG